MEKFKDQQIQTYGIKYTGSKLKLLPYILQVISELPDVHFVLDGFAGTTRVSQALVQFGYDVAVNDISVWSKTFANCFLKANKPDSFYQKYIDELNSLKGKVGWFTKTYSNESLKKAPFQKKNLMKLDAIREKIDEYNLEEVDKDVLLTSLIFALDKVDSTIGHFSSYLSEWSPRSYNDLELVMPVLKRPSTKVDIYQGDIFECLKQGKWDLAYFDPPYGSNNEKMPPSRVRYASYYHIWKTVILNDHPKLFGTVGRREDSRDEVAGSKFEEFRKDSEGRYIATNTIKELAEKTNAKYLLFSYSNGGRATKQELLNIFNSVGDIVKVVEIDYKQNVMSGMKWTNEWLNEDRKNVEYLFLVKKHNQ